MSAANLKFIDVAFSYDTSVEPLFKSLNIHFSSGWTGIAGANGAGKSTIARLSAGSLKPLSGRINTSDFTGRYYCEQKTENLPRLAEDFLYSDDSASGKLRSMLEIEDDWLYRWETLSHGERKKLQIGAALWYEPEILILDEPVNHIDINTCKLLLTSLKAYKGIGIIISHDRSFLDSLCCSCIFLNSGSAVMRRGNYSDGLAVLKREEAANRKLYEEAVRKYKSLNNSAASVKRKEDSRAPGLSKKKLDKHDHDSKSKIDAARLTGKDKTGAKKAKLLENRVEKLKENAESIYSRKRNIDGITFNGEKSRQAALIRCEGRSIMLNEKRRIRIPELIIGPGDRIAVTGANGSGKSSLIKYLVKKTTINESRMLYIPQEIDSSEWKKLRNEIHNLGKDELGMLLSAVHRLGSEPEPVITSECPSPGERRKLMLAMGLLKEPVLIIMDEPTNHMDLPSIICIEDALVAYNGALLIVSHDESFIKNTSDILWEIKRTKSEEGGTRGDLYELIPHSY